ncbi:MAG TPA: hypothetical protein VJ850_02485 [Candidatus Limnocylindrales bacterium]|nr:hypothetical protein [Candidatus Limnocylindrales bacterium]
MHDLTTFERSLADRLDVEVAGSISPFDAASIARSAMTRRTRGDTILTRIGLGNALPLPATTRRLIVGLVVAGLLLVTVALAIGFAHLGGARLAVVRQNGDLVVANADGTAPQVIGHMPTSSIYLQVSIAPDGSHVAYVGDDWLLTVVDLSGAVAFQRTMDHGFSHFAWSPDGRELALLDGALLSREGPDDAGPPVVKPHLDIVPVDGSPARSIALPDGFRYVMGLGNIAWSGDGGRLAITGFGANQQPSLFPSSIWTVDLATGDVRDLRSPATTSDFYPRWLPDGRILFSRTNRGLAVIDPTTGTDTLVFEPPKPWTGSMTIQYLDTSPDGKRVAFVAPNIGLAILDLASGAVSEVELAAGGGMPPVQWSADGRSLLSRWSLDVSTPFWPTSIAAVDIATGVPTVLADDGLAFDVRH